MSALVSLLQSIDVSLSPRSIALLDSYADLLRRYNARYNLVARTDIEHVATRHVAHCLALATRVFSGGSVVVDWGTGGGLPLMPLAIIFAEVRFVGVDAVEKKTLAVRAMVRELGLVNVETWHGRAEVFRLPHAYSVSRATAPLSKLWGWHVRNAIDHAQHEGEWAPGLVCLKGGELGEEIREIARAYPHARVTVAPVGLPGYYFEGKHIVTVTAGEGTGA